MCCGWHHTLLQCPTIQWLSPQNSLGQSPIAEGFAEAKSVCIVITSAKILLRWLFPSKIYTHFKIFNTYFFTKLLFTNNRYHLHLLEKCLYVLQEVRSIIYCQHFIHPPYLLFLNSFFRLIFFRSRTRHYRVSNSCSNVFISMNLFRKKENTKVLTYGLDNTRIIFVILWLC